VSSEAPASKGLQYYMIGFLGNITMCVTCVSEFQKYSFVISSSNARGM
jgi:hypothetical protein